MNRAKLSQAVLQGGARDFFQKLDRRFEVRYYAFSSQAARIGTDARAIRLPEPPKPGGSSTRIGDAIAQVNEDTAGSQLAGVFLFSDGQHNAGRPAAEAVRAMKAPLFAVPVGARARLKDVAIVDVFTTSQVTVKDTALVAVTVESHGFDGRPVKVELRDGDNLLDTKEIILRDAEQQQVELSFKADKPGLRNLTVSVPAQPEEAEHLHANNRDNVSVRVSEEKIKVLLIEGRPHWDFRFLKNYLRRDNGVGGRDKPQVDIVLEAEWRRLPLAQQKEALPATLKDLAKYNTVIIGDASPALLNAGFVKLLDEAVRKKGVGLIVQAGTQNMPHRHGDALHNLLPVRVTRGVGGRQPRGTPSFRLELAPEGMLNEATRFYDEPGRNQTAWSNLPRYYWCAAVQRQAPGATVLVYNPIATSFGKMPLVAHHFAGDGRVMFVGTDETFRWRQNVGERFFGRFWGQAVRFVARREEGSKKSRLEIHPARTTPGEPVEVELFAFGAGGIPLIAEEVKVKMVGGGVDDSLTLKPDANAKGRYTARFTPTEPGDYVATYMPVGQTKPLEARMRVSGAAEEMRQPNVDRLGLADLAAASGRSEKEKGRLVELSDLTNADKLAQIEALLQGDSRYTELNRETSIWDNWVVLALLVFLYTLDVGLRRLTGLS
jgi:hypothetical protein